MLFGKKKSSPATGEPDCPNGLCSRQPTGKAAPTYGQEPAGGETETAVFAQG